MGQEGEMFAQRYREPRESSFSSPLIATCRSSSFPSWYSQERYTFIKKEEGMTILKSLIETGIKMAQNPSNETILFSTDCKVSSVNNLALI